MTNNKSMRDIKFRAWDKELNRMVSFTNGKDGIQYCLGEFWVSDGYNGYGDPTYNTDNTSRFVIMQYTGLKDKNGKEIYEGDVFKTNNSAIGHVSYDTDGFITSIEDERWHGIRNDQLGYAVECEIEIIGNIYENPELISPALCA